MKIIFLCSFLFFTPFGFTQAVDYCNYFNLEVTESGKLWKKVKSCRPVVRKKKNDSFTTFLINHSLRFEYIIAKNPSKFLKLRDHYPDTAKIRSKFCSEVIGTPTMLDYFIDLTPKDLSTWDTEVDTFTVDELMLAASRFFYCDKVNKLDTTVQAHICVAIHGQNEYKSDRDLTLLEAFSIEAILNNAWMEPSIFSAFAEHRRRFTQEQKTDFIDFENFLVDVQKLCFEEMEKNEALKRMLLNYYEKHKTNLNFELI